MLRIDFDVNQPFVGNYTEEKKDGVTYLHIHAESPEEAELKMHVNVEEASHGTNVFWQPKTDRKKTFNFNWAQRHYSSAAFSVPLIANVGYDDVNRLTLACSDCMSPIDIHSGAVHESANISNCLDIAPDKKLTTYDCTVRIDERPLPFSTTVSEVADWWKNDCGYTPAPIPECAYDTVFSTWYSFLHKVSAAEVLEECRAFSKLGCKTVIIDDGWQRYGDNIPMGDNGDWIPSPEKFPDMRAFSEEVHKLGMKVMLWFPTPYIGKNTKAYERLKDYCLERPWECDHVIADLRYPEIRAHLVNVFKSAMADYDLDGLKLDYIDSYHNPQPVKEGMDYVSIHDALDTFLAEVRDAVNAVKPDAMLEFRQDYDGPIMGKYATMFRAMDCPNDSLTNRIYTLDLRLFAKYTPAHSDMLLWHESEDAVKSAYQLTNVLFSVPQISVRWNEITPDHRTMLAFYLRFIDENRDVLYHGEMLCRGLSADYTYASSKKDGVEIAALYSGNTPILREGVREYKLVNASPAKHIYLESPEKFAFTYEIRDCMGSLVSSASADFDDGFVRLEMPENGVLTLKRV